LTLTYGANHWSSQAIGHWLRTNSITVDGLTDALILFAIGLVLARAIRFARVLRQTTAIGDGPKTQPPPPGRRIALRAHRAARPSTAK
jgi:hypothetical protein